MLCIFQTAKLHKQSTLQVDGPLTKMSQTGLVATQLKVCVIHTQYAIGDLNNHNFEGSENVKNITFNMQTLTNGFTCG